MYYRYLSIVDLLSIVYSSIYEYRIVRYVLTGTGTRLSTTAAVHVEIIDSARYLVQLYRYDRLPHGR
jgi:hypothetical protein